VVASFSSSASTPSASSKPSSFIELAKLNGAQSLLGPLPVHGGRFDSAFSNLQITKMDPSGDVETTMVVDQKVENSYGTLHGGAIATLVDIVGTLALLAKDNKRGGVTVDLNVSYTAAIKASNTDTSALGASRPSFAVTIVLGTIFFLLSFRAHPFGSAISPRKELNRTPDTYRRCEE
jgi:uncharacterized protein (TIGR00369 family)